MLGRESRDNVTKALNFIYAARTRKIQGLLLSTDAEKAFDWVAWDYMLGTCRFIGLGTRMMTWISSLYKNPSAELRLTAPYQTHFRLRMERGRVVPSHPSYLSYLWGLSLEWS